MEPPCIDLYAYVNGLELRQNSYFFAASPKAGFFTHDKDLQPPGFFILHACEIEIDQAACVSASPPGMRHLASGVP